MSITDELREWMDRTTTRFDGCRYLLGTDEELTAIADRIDAKHQKAEDEWRAKNGDMWLKGYNVCHKELMEGHPVIVADLEKAGFVKLPVDADGVPWYIGDVTENGQTIEAMGLNRHGWHFVGTVNEIDPAIHRHHHPDTWERIIEDATALGAQMGRRTTQVDDLVARCKALAGDTE